MELKRHGLRRQTPDAYLAGIYDKAPDLTVAPLSNARRNLNKTLASAAGFLEILDNQKLARLAIRMRKYSTDLQGENMGT